MEGNCEKSFLTDKTGVLWLMLSEHEQGPIVTNPFLDLERLDLAPKQTCPAFDYMMATIGYYVLNRMFYMKKNLDQSS
ncbi:hypothetical protein DPMN_110442 [Dreissena polymorpha]|uniref:Uncharacterized protein n=1 Tax=Dreissena polymorpha TaxID=45954 RepID=A0A9D4KCU9_DREPO|nr:hypothetical protein DPMN_110442 [Dreissena polymorpha]